MKKRRRKIRSTYRRVMGRVLDRVQLYALTH